VCVTATSENQLRSIRTRTDDISDDIRLSLNDKYSLRLSDTVDCTMSMVNVSQNMEDAIRFKAGVSGLSGMELIPLIERELTQELGRIPLRHHTGVIEFRLLSKKDRHEAICQVLGLVEPLTLVDAADALAKVIRDGLLGSTEDNLKRARLAGFSNPRGWGRAVLKTYEKLR